MLDFRFAIALVSAWGLLAFAIAGCGNSAADGEGNGGSVAAADGGGVSPTKAEFIEKADAICERTDKAQKDAQRVFLKENPEADSSNPWEEKLVLVVGLPPVQILANELSDLPVPKGDEDEIEAIVEGLEAAVDEARANPSSLLKKGSAGPFTGVVELAQEYGFNACAQPL